MKKILLILFIFSNIAYSQHNAKLCHLDFLSEISYLNSDTNIIHTSIKPFTCNKIITNKNSSNLLNRNLINYKTDNSFFYINPIITNLFYIEKSGKFINQNSNGFDINADIKQLSINYSPQIHFLKFSQNYTYIVDSTRIINELGNNFAKKGNYYQLFTNDFTISFTPKKYFNFLAGNNKTFLGEGYRSLFLSDQNSSFPFIRTTVSAWKIKYLIQYNFLKDIDYENSTTIFEKKYSAIHYLSWNVFKNFDIHLFETVIWRGKDSLGNRGFDVNYLNPVVFYRPIDFSIGSPDNIIMGAGGKIKFLKHNHLYGQVVLDEFKLIELKADSGWWGNKFGIQAGFKSYRFLNIHNLFFLFEANFVKPFTYSHETSIQNHGNLYQPLAHPLGANFTEIIAILNYKFKKSNFFIKFIKSEHGVDSSTTNYGGNIYRSYNNSRNEYGNYLLQGKKIENLYIELKYRYTINPEWNLCFETGIIHKKTNLLNINENYIFLGFRTNLYNYNILID